MKEATIVGSFLLLFVIGEVIASVVFLIIRGSLLGKGASFKPLDIESIKGMLERLVLMLALVAGHPTILVMFGTLKLGTRLNNESGDEKKKAISNNYFLIGNFASVLVSIIDAIAWAYLVKP